MVQWISTNGGCDWKPAIQWNSILDASFEFYSADVLKLTSNVTSKHSGTPSEIFQDYDILWTKVGFLRLATVSNNSNHMMLLLNGEITESNNPYLDSDIFGVTETGKGFRLEFLPNDIKFPEIWNGTFVKLGDDLCRVNTVLNATIEISCNNNNLTVTSIVDFLQQRRWFNVDLFYSRKIECHDDFTVNSTTITLPKKSDTEIDHVVFTAPLRHVLVGKNNDLSLTFKNPLSTIPDTSKEVCLYQKYKTFQEFIYENPNDDCPVKFTVAGINDSNIYLDIDEHLEMSVNMTIDMSVPLHEDISDFDWLKIQVSNPEIVCLRTYREKSRRAERIDLKFHQTLAISGINAVTIKSSIYNSLRM